MARLLAATMVLALTAVVTGDGPARASTPAADPPLLERTAAPACCMPGGGYRARTQFVSELFRSVEAL